MKIRLPFPALAALAALPVPSSFAASCCTPPPQASSAVAACVASPAPRTTFSPHSLYQAAGSFIDDRGVPSTLARFHGRPVVVALIFTHCGYACPLIVTDLVRLQARLSAAERREAAFVLISFDVARDTPDALARYRTQRGLDDTWTLLHGDSDSVLEIAALLGVKYQPEPAGGFAHSNLFTVLNRDGEIVHQRTGLSGGLDEALAALVSAGR